MELIGDYLSSESDEENEPLQRTRQTPHVVGNWPTLFFIKMSPDIPPELTRLISSKIPGVTL
jgi:hypothetical protein